jgi:hypothetical protein
LDRVVIDSPFRGKEVVHQVETSERGFGQSEAYVGEAEGPAKFQFFSEPQASDLLDIAGGAERRVGSESAASENSGHHTLLG